MAHPPSVWEIAYCQGIQSDQFLFPASALHKVGSGLDILVSERGPESLNSNLSSALLFVS